MNPRPRYRVDEYDSFERLPAAHVTLLAEAPSFDQSLVWYRAFARHLLGDSDRLSILAVADAAGAAAAVMPVRRANASRGLVPVRSASALANYYTALFGPILAADTDQTAASQAMAEGLAALSPPWNLLDLNPLAREHPFFELCARTLRARGCLVQPYFRFGNWYLRVRGRSFGEYLDEMPGRMRSTLIRKSKKLSSRGDVEIQIVQDPTRTEDALSAYGRIYARSWKQDEPHKAFIREVVQRFAEQGWLRLGIIRVGGVPAAAQIWFVYRGTASIFKLAYDPDFAELSVGSVLTMKLMEHALEVDRVTVVDYLCGDDAYKRDWMSDRRERWGLRASPWLSFVGVTELIMAVGSRLKWKSARPIADAGGAASDRAVA